MKKTSLLLLFILILLVLFVTSCLTGRKLETKQYIYLDKKNINLIIDESSSAKYLNHLSADEYKEVFVAELADRLKDFNIILLNESNEHLTVKLKESYTLKIAEIKYYEQKKTGKTPKNDYENNESENLITNCEISLNFTIGKEPFSFLAFNNHNIIVSKEEKIKNNRNTSGTNKDSLVYTNHELDDDVFVDLTKNLATKTAAKISRVISTNMEKHNKTYGYPAKI